jgi:hypothetical protein
MGRTGIRFMGGMPWGTLFYESPQDLLDTAVCYFEAGLESNELCRQSLIRSHHGRRR